MNSYTLYAAPANGTGAVQSFGAGNSQQRVAAEMTCDPGVTAATVTVQGSADGVTFVPLLTFTNGLRCAGVWFSASSPYYAFNTIVSSYAGTGNVTVRADIRERGSAGPGVGAF